MLFQISETDSQQTSLSLLITAPPLALSSAAFHLRLKTEPFNLTYLDSILLRHNTFAITTDCNRSPMLSPSTLTFSDFDMTPKQNEKPGYCCHDLVYRMRKSRSS